MSYARFGSDGSDVYVFLSVDGMYECCFCILQKREWVDEPDRFLGGYFRDVGEKVEDRFDTPDGILAHLELHVTAGHTVPDYTFENLRAEAAA